MLNANFNGFGLLPIEIPNDGQVKSFGAFERSDDGVLSAYIGITADFRAIFFDANAGNCRIYRDEDIESSVIVVKLLELISENPETKRLVPQEYKQALGL